jgi:hypothetical protein
MLGPLDLDYAPSLLKTSSALEEELGVGDLDGLVDLSAWGSMVEGNKENSADSMVDNVMMGTAIPGVNAMSGIHVKPEPKDAEHDGFLSGGGLDPCGLQVVDVKIEALNLQEDSLDNGFNFDSLVPMLQVKTELESVSKSCFGKTKRRKLSEDKEITVNRVSKESLLVAGAKVASEAKPRKGAVYKPGEVTISKDNKIIIRRGPRGKYVCRRCGAKKGGHICTVKSIRSVQTQADLSITNNSRGNSLSRSEITKNKYTFLQVKNKWHTKSAQHSPSAISMTHLWTPGMAALAAMNARGQFTAANATQ